MEDKFGTTVVNENSDLIWARSAVETIIINCDNFFPWDIAADDGTPPNGVVNIQDIVRVVNHFTEFKP